MGDEPTNDEPRLPRLTTAKYVQRWPRWWDDIERPDGPFPAFSQMDGFNSGPEEILRRAERIVRGDTPT